MSPFPREAYQPLEPYAPDRRPVEVDLSDNTNRWGAHPGALRAIREADPESLLRYPSVYADGLKAALSARYGVPASAISTGCGSDDLLDSVFRAAGEPGDGVAYLPPTFSMVEIFARMNGLEPRPVASPPPEAPGALGALPDPEALLAAAAGDGSRGPGLVYLCRPNNPTGELQPRGWVDALVQGSAALGDRAPILLIDEAYADFASDAYLKDAPSLHRVLVVRTLSKLHGLAGLRVGFAVGSPEVIREVEKSRGPYKVNRLAELAALAALNDPEGWVEDVRIEMLKGRARLTFELAARGYTPLPSAANFVFVPVDDAVALTAYLRIKGIAVRPFAAPETETDASVPTLGDGIRISVGPPHEIDALLAALDDLNP
jgi:histidinol-phosphate aminotransferase